MKRAVSISIGSSKRNKAVEVTLLGEKVSIERIGTERYPPEARGRQYDALIITVEIDREGRVVDVIINRKSRYDALNRAVRQIVYAGQPYARFSPEMARQGDILQIVRTWTFTHDGLETRTLRSDR